MILELINNGDEKELKPFYENNKIIFLDNYDLSNDINKKEKLFLNLFEDIYYNIKSNLNNNKLEEKCEIEKEEQYNKDKNTIDDFANYIVNGQSIFGKCF